MILTVPEEDPVVIHPPVPIVAIDGLLVPHVPPTVISVRQVDDPKQTECEPVIATGIGLTVTGTVVLHPVGNV